MMSIRQQKATWNDAARAFVRAVPPERRSSTLGETARKRTALSCIEACVMLEAECRRTLAADSSASRESGRLPAAHLRLLACAQACQATLSALVRTDRNAPEIASWCAEMCVRIAKGPQSTSRPWAAVVASAEQCAAHCGDFCAAWLAPGQLEMPNDSRVARETNPSPTGVP